MTLIVCIALCTLSYHWYCSLSIIGNASTALRKLKVFVVKLAEILADRTNGRTYADRGLVPKNYQ